MDIFLFFAGFIYLPVSLVVSATARNKDETGIGLIFFVISMATLTPLAVNIGKDFQYNEPTYHEITTVTINGVSKQFFEYEQKILEVPSYFYLPGEKIVSVQTIKSRWIGIVHYVTAKERLIKVVNKQR